MKKVSTCGVSYINYIAHQLFLQSDIIISVMWYVCVVIYHDEWIVMIYLKFIPVILYLVEVFGSPLDDTTNPIDVQNRLNDKGTSNTPKL